MLWFPRSPLNRLAKSLDYSWHSGFLFSLINYRWWLGRKVSLGAAKWRGIGNDFHRSSVYRNDGKLANAHHPSTLTFNPIFCFFPSAARKRSLILRSTWLPRYLFMCGPELLFDSWALPANPLDQREYCTKGCYISRQQVRSGEKPLRDYRRFVHKFKLNYYET